jgi:hypothetical protein
MKALPGKINSPGRDAYTSLPPNPAGSVFEPCGSLSNSEAMVASWYRAMGYL